MLVVVLIICLGLVSITLLFGHSMLMAYRGEDNDLAALQAQNAIEGAIRYTELLMAASDASNSTTTVTNSLPTLTNNASSSTVATAGVMPDPTLYQSGAVSVGAAKFWFIGEPPVTGQTNVNSGVNAISSSASGGIAGATDQPVFGLVDEASKLNLNRASYAMLMLLPGMTDDLANAIVSWRTLPGSTDPGAGGGTGTTLLDGGVKSAPFESVEELAQVNGGTDLSTLYGSDTNLNHCLDAEEQINGLAQLTPGLLEYFTVFSRECNLLSDGTKRINISTPARSGLNTLLTNTLGAARATAIMNNFPGSSPFHPTATKVGSVLEFYEAIPDITSAEMDQIGDRLTVTTGAYTTGMVNVNTASLTVLACIPGLADKAAQIVATRQAQTQPLTNFFWVLPIIKGPSASLAGPYLTAHSYQISADIAAVGRHGRGYRRTRVVIDSTGPAPQIVYRRDLTSLGWALGSSVRQNLAQIVDTNNTAGAAAR